MVTEQERTLEALKIAISMETDGKEYYLKASASSSSKVGKELLKSLAEAEDRHKQVFTSIYQAISSKKAWPKVELAKDVGKKLRTILSGAPVGKSPVAKADSSELDAIQTAIDMEVKTYDFYTAEGSKATYDIEKEFYQRLSAEERQHQLVLVDYYDYLKDPAQYFTMKEHHSLDGG
jgi:rubrerythrin